MIFASRVRPSASLTAAARENIPARLRAGFPAMTSRHPVSSRRHLTPTCISAQTECPSFGFTCKDLARCRNAQNRVQREMAYGIFQGYLANALDALDRGEGRTTAAQQASHLLPGVTILARASAGLVRMRTGSTPTPLGRIDA
jgi:hypothetical protein